MSTPEEDAEKARRRFARETAAHNRKADLEATCCFLFFSSSPKKRENSNVWRNCPKCGKPLVYK